MPPEQRNIFYARLRRGSTAGRERLRPAHVGAMTKRAVLMVVLALALVGFAMWSLTRVPTGFLPTEDQGYMIVVAQLPDGASKERTDAVLRRSEASPREFPASTMS